MYQTKNDDLDHTRADVLALLNAWLADSIHLMAQVPPKGRESMTATR